MYTELKLAYVQKTLRRLANRIRERFPDSGLSQVAAELCVLVVLDAVNDIPVPAQK